MSVLVATDAAAVAGVKEATTVVRTSEAGSTAVDVAAGAEDLPLLDIRVSARNCITRRAIFDDFLSWHMISVTPFSRRGQ
eukprot:3904328-Pleurochrysis_carterae.AAC.1